MDFSMIQSLMAPPDITGLRKVLCIQPHPDDNEIGMGGIIAKLTSNGTQVDYLTVTDGSLGDIGLAEGDLRTIRRQEAEQSAKLLGVSDLYFLDKKDGTLNDVPSLAREIADLVRKNAYDAICCPDPYNSYEAHYDHIVTGLAASQAAISVNLRNYPEGTDTKPIDLKAVLYYFTQSPNTKVDITQYFELKMRAVSLHKSQITAQMLELYTGYFAFRGRNLSQTDAICEGVKALTPLHLHCIPESQMI